MANRPPPGFRKAPSAKPEGLSRWLVGDLRSRRMIEVFVGADPLIDPARTDKSSISRSRTRGSYRTKSGKLKMGGPLPNPPPTAQEREPRPLSRAQESNLPYPFASRNSFCSVLETNASNSSGLKSPAGGRSSRGIGPKPSRIERIRVEASLGGEGLRG